MSCPSAVLAQGESGVGCTPLSPLSATHMTTESGSGASLGIESAMDVIVNKDLVEGSPLTETVDRQAFQIFPDLEEVALGAEGCAGDGYSRERLPSIMVEPTELDNMEGRELCWPPEELAVLVDEDPFSEPCTAPTNPTDSTRHEEQSGDEKGSPSKGGVQRRQSNSPTAAQLSCFRLTPPPACHSPEEMPPCLRS